MSNNCLICFKPWEILTPVLENGIPGGINCTSLELQLQQYFVLRQLLNIPSIWCEEALSLEENGSPDQWFRVCSECITNLVEPTWKIYQQIQNLERKMNHIRELTRQKMFKSIKEMMSCQYQEKEQKPKLYPFDGTSLKDKIISKLFPCIATDGFFKVEPDVYDGNDDADNEPFHVNENVTDNDDMREFESTSVDQFKLDSSEQQSSSDESFESSYGKGRVKVKNKKQGKPPPRKEIKRRRGKGKAPKGNKSRTRGVNWSWYCCKQCPAKFINAEELEGHLKSHAESAKTGGLFDCSICSYPAHSSGDLEIHINHSHTIKPEHKNKKQSCPKCDFVTITWEALKVHCEKEHPEMAEDKSFNFQLQCPVCEKRFENRRLQMRHTKQQHPEEVGAPKETIACDQCPQLFQSRIHLQYHINKVHLRATKYSCDFCKKGFKFFKALQVHKISHEKDNRNFVCEQCGLDYSYQSALVSHLKKFHPEVGSSNNNNVGSSGESQPSTSQKEYSCKHCDMKSPYKPVMMRHLKTHISNLGHQCNLCDKAYSSSNGLKRHQRLNHSTSKEIVPCPYCCKEFPSVDYMKSHCLKYCKMKLLKATTSENQTSNDQVTENS